MRDRNRDRAEEDEDGNEKSLCDDGIGRGKKKGADRWILVGIELGGLLKH